MRRNRVRTGHIYTRGAMNLNDRVRLYCQRSFVPGTANLTEALEETHERFRNEFRQGYPRWVDRPLRIKFGDHWTPYEYPTLTKSRVIGDPNGILLPLSRERHWGWRPEVIASIDTKWSNKQPTMVWRGITSGAEGVESQRAILVKRWIDHSPQMDIAFSHTTPELNEVLGPWVRGKLSIKEQLRHAFILAIEGNDVATNLKWILLSRSVPIMPHPRFETWLLESQLKPWIHYVPVRDDFEDLAEVLAWCQANMSMCKQIGEAGRSYIVQFMNLPCERRVAEQVLCCYERK